MRKAEASKRSRLDAQVREGFGDRRGRATFSSSAYLHHSFARRPADVKKLVVLASGCCQAVPSQHRWRSVIRCCVTKYIPTAPNAPEVGAHLHISSRAWGVGTLVGW